MRIPINLASEPFRRDRASIVGATAVGGVLVVLLGILIYLAVIEKHATADTVATRDRMDRQDRQLTRELAQLNRTLQQPDTSEVLEQSVFLNELIRRKGVSWTQLFADLEKVLPPDVRLISIRPQINSNGRVNLDMQVGSAKGENVLALLVKLEGSPLFGETQVLNVLPPSQTEPLIRYRINVNYAQKL